MLLGLPGDATYANYREANKALWRQAILPLAGKILDALAQGLRPWFPGLALDVDLDAVPALAEDRERLWAQLGAADFLTVNEKREAAGFAALAEPVPPDDLEPPPAGNDNEIGAIGAAEVKFNPNHDPENGRFTFGNGSANVAAGGGSFGGGGASGSFGKAPAKPKPAVQPAKPKPTARPAERLPSVRPVQQRTRPVGAKPPQSSRPKTTRVSTNGYDFDIDDKQRTVRASGELRLDPTQKRSRAAQSEAGKPDRLPKDHGGHLIGRQFAGPEIRENHIAQNAKLNLGRYKVLKNEWRSYLRAGKRVVVDIRAKYPASSKRPSRIDATYYVNGKKKSRGFRNIK